MRNSPPERDRPGGPRCATRTPATSTLSERSAVRPHLDPAAAVAAWSRIADPAVRDAIAGALDDLMAGNRRFVAGARAARLHGERAALVSGQRPAPPSSPARTRESRSRTRSDAPLGTLFGTKTRSALDSAVLGSLEFAVATLGSSLSCARAREVRRRPRRHDGDTPPGRSGAHRPAPCPHLRRGRT